MISSGTEFWQRLKQCMNDNQLHLDRIKKAIGKIKKYLADKTSEDLQQDDLLYDAILMKLFLIGEETSRIDDDFKEKNNKIPWHKMSGMRNRIAHEYFHVDAKVVWDTCSNDLPELEETLDKV